MAHGHTRIVPRPAQKAAMVVGTQEWTKPKFFLEKVCGENLLPNISGEETPSLFLYVIQSNKDKYASQKNG
jgi:hypothetical protein